LTDSVDAQGEKGETGGRPLEMDKLEAELEKKKEPKPVEESGWAETEAEVKPRDTRWGHEGFESMQAVQQFQANRNFRGRGRGRGFPGESE